MAFFYEIRKADETVLKRIGGFTDREAAKIAGLAEAKKMKNSHQPGVPPIGRVMIGQNREAPTRN